MGIFSAIGGVIFVVGLLMFGGAVQAFWRASAQKQAWHRVTGTVLEPTWSTSTFFRPVVEFTTRGGRVMQWKQGYFSGWHFNPRGARVAMLYDPEDPRRARFERGGTFGFDTMGCFFLSKAVALTTFGFLFLAFGGIGMCVERRIAAPHPPAGVPPAQVQRPATQTTASRSEPARTPSKAAATEPSKPRDLGEAWVVGSRGLLLHCASSECEKVDAGVTSDLLAISGAGKAAWAVGAGGVVLRLDGKSWKKESSGVSTTLRSVWARTSGDVWAVGDQGTVVHFDGSAWSAKMLPPRQKATTILAVHGSAPDDVWVTTASNAVLQWDGRAWSERGSFPPSSGPLRAIAVFSPKYVLLGNGTDLLRWDGTKWQPDNTATPFTVGAFAINDGEPWACTSDGLRKRVAGRWEPIQLGDGAGEPQAVAVGGPNDAWVVGANGGVLRYSSAAWRPIESGTSEKLAAVWSPAAGP